MPPELNGNYPILKQMYNIYKTKNDYDLITEKHLS
jgi:hypothetical protein